MPSSFETSGRWTKAWRLALALQPREVTADMARGWTDDQWKTAAGLAGVRPPSETTRAMVVGLLAGSAKAA
jgi:hypothetical protein